MKRLSIIVPYRARQQHLRDFVAHLRGYFARDKLDKAIPYRVLIVEQEPGLPFNRGALLNIGFILEREQSDYVCFHDVDYLPIWADYSWTEQPSRIIWYGADWRPIASGHSDLHTANDREHFFGAVILTPNEAFERVNGYSNRYWGWGFEDLDLRRRFLAANIGISRRDGTYSPLYHDNLGFQRDGKPTPIWFVNERLYRETWAGGEPRAADGLNTVSFTILNRAPIPDPRPERAAPWEMAKVHLTMAPSTEQFRAAQVGA
jgi:hypothetical protein